MLRNSSVNIPRRLAGTHHNNLSTSNRTVLKRKLSLINLINWKREWKRWRWMCLEFKSGIHGNKWDVLRISCAYDGTIPWLRHIRSRYYRNPYSFFLNSKGWDNLQISLHPWSWIFHIPPWMWWGKLDPILKGQVETEDTKCIA